MIDSNSRNLQERAREMVEFSVTASHRRTAKKWEKKNKRQAGKEAPAAPQTVHDTARSQSVFQAHNEMSEEQERR